MQPIELQNMYSQLSNVAKAVGGQQQTSQLSESLQQQAQIQKNMENATRIQKTNENTSAKNINPDGRNGSGFSGTSKKKNGQKDGQNKYYSDNSGESGAATGSEGFRNNESPFLGTIVDIIR